MKVKITVEVDVDMSVIGARPTTIRALPILERRITSDVKQQIPTGSEVKVNWEVYESPEAL